MALTLNEISDRIEGLRAEHAKWQIPILSPERFLARNNKTLLQFSSLLQLRMWLQLKTLEKIGKFSDNLPNPGLDRPRRVRGCAVSTEQSGPLRILHSALDT
jgi:hypothetical protein